MSFWGQVCVAERLVLSVAGRRFLPGPGPHVSVRWRKPFALGTAPSKMFRIPKKPVMPDDQTVELMRLTKNYKTYMRSIRMWMTSELAAQEAAVQKGVEGATGEEAEHQRCMKINQQWNEQVAKEREVRLAKEREATMEKILTDLQQEETEKSQRMAEIKQMVAAEKEVSSEYITEANIDDAIQQALSTEVDHNYAIDRAGSYIYGYDTKSEKPAPEPSSELKSVY